MDVPILQWAKSLIEMRLYLWFLAHLQVGTHGVKSSCSAHVKMGLVEWLQHFDEIWALPLIKQK